MNQKEQEREAYILKNLVKHYRVFKTANWVSIVLVVLYVGIIVYRMKNGGNLPKISYPMFVRFLAVGVWCFYIRSLEKKYKAGVDETRQAMDDPLFQGYSSQAWEVRKSIINCATLKTIMGATFVGLGIFFLAVDILLFNISWKNSLWTLSDLVLCYGFLIAGILMVAWGISECKDAPEGKRLFGEN